MRPHGAHITISKGYKYLNEIAKKLNIQAIQIHPTPPQRYATKIPEDSHFETLAKTNKGSPLQLIFLHAIYLINLAQPDKQKFHLSKMSLVTYLQIQHLINHYAKLYKVPIRCEGVVVHVGSAKHYNNEEEAMERVIQGVNWILDNTPTDTILLLETSAGSGKIIGDRFEELAYIREHVTQPHRVGYTLDTQHLYSSGYDIVNAPHSVAEEAAQILGRENIKLIHINDSPYPLGAKKDRHENLGNGTIGLEGIKNFINMPQLKDIPVVLETPNVKTEQTLEKEIKILKQLLQ